MWNVALLAQKVEVSCLRLKQSRLVRAKLVPPPSSKGPGTGRSGWGHSQDPQREGRNFSQALAVNHEAALS